MRLQHLYRDAAQKGTRQRSGKVRMADFSGPTRLDSIFGCRLAAESGTAAAPDAVAKAFDRAWDRHMALWREGLVSGAAQVAEWGLACLGAVAEGPPLKHLVMHFEEASHSSRLVALESAAKSSTV